MSLAEEMREIADRLKPKFTGEQKASLLRDIKEQAEQGKYTYDYNCRGICKDVCDFIESHGFGVSQFSRNVTNGEIFSIQISWKGDTDEQRV